ncbi:hypothetical protein CTheo_8031 [Ceratobasidium theobromae]|uniref:Tc1-like transposase DDE domain-containing protein n=1 Tax=Ceratobasidium theobromae TaxID=1582974 RepID=A0A5N5Q9R5_9AGAM|nr:hypothetical protein CTheo_8031 [Ceratobasidium theobromae]
MRVLYTRKNLDTLRDGWFTCAQVVEQLQNAIKIVEEAYPEYTHIFVYDSAPSHTKRPEDAISVRNMPKNPSKEFPRLQKSKNGDRVVPPRMEPGKLPDGRPQSFYFPDDHPTYPGYFKGMAQMLQERGLGDIATKLTQCPDFKCKEGEHELLLSAGAVQPDFKAHDSSLQEAARKLGSRAVFLPKYHCELNPIEQCWGYAKREYREMPASNKESVMKQYFVDAVDSIPLLSIRK